LAYLINDWRYSFGKSETNKTFRKPRHGSNKNITFDLELVTFEARDCMNVV
jgi:hypothetical protein